MKIDEALHTWGNRLISRAFAAIIFATSQVGTASSLCELDIKTASPVAANPRHTEVIMALSSSTVDPARKLAILNDWVRTPSHSAADTALQNRARIYLAAHAIQSMDGRSARSLLAPITTDSLAATDAGLLTAESWRVEGDDRKALEWFLRVGRHFPFDVSALNGLLEAAQSLLDDGKPELAAALHSEVLERALHASEQLRTLPAAPSELAAAIFNPDSNLPNRLRQQTTRLVLQHAPETPKARRMARHAERHWRCLLIQQQALEERRAITLQQVSQLEHAILMIDEQTTQQQNQIDQLGKRIIPGDFSAEQMVLRRSLSQTRNTLIRLAAQRDFLLQAQATLPAMLADTEARLDTLSNFYDTVRSNADAEMYEGLSRSIGLLDDQFRNLAAQSQSRQAELISRVRTSTTTRSSAP